MKLEDIKIGGKYAMLRPRQPSRYDGGRPINTKWVEVEVVDIGVARVLDTKHGTVREARTRFGSPTGRTERTVTNGDYAPDRYKTTKGIVVRLLRTVHFNPYRDEPVDISAPPVGADGDDLRMITGRALAGDAVEYFDAKAEEVRKFFDYTNTVAEENEGIEEAGELLNNRFDDLGMGRPVKIDRARLSPGARSSISLHFRGAEAIGELLNRLEK